MSALLPQGITSISDAPFNLVNAITTALGYLSFEQHAVEDRPPRRIWQDPEKLKAHWAAVRKRWKDGADGNDVEDPVDNAAAAGLIVGG